MFQDTLSRIVAQLEEAKDQGLLQEFGLIGGLAIAAWGNPRATQDIDFAIALGGAHPSGLATFLGGTYKEGDQDDPLKGVIRVNFLKTPEPIPIQLIMLPSVWAEVVFKNIHNLRLGENMIPVVSWEALLLLKLYAGGAKDLLDAQALFAHQQPNASAHNHVTTMAEKVGLTREWDMFLKNISDRGT